jgi:hypothetical protein
MVLEHTEEEYELISKEILKNIRQENLALKSELTKTPFHYNGQDQTPDQFIHQMIEAFRKETKKDHDEFLVQVKEIKDITKSTLDNLLQKNLEQNQRLEQITTHFQDLIKTISEFVDYSAQENQANMKKLLDAITTSVQENSFSAQSTIDTKLFEIQNFMNNLKTLLAQIKPAQMTLTNSTGLPPLGQLK